MKISYSEKTGGFYLDCVKYNSLPDDLIEVSEDEYQAALSISDGETLDVINGKIVIAPAPERGDADPLRVSIESAKKLVESIVSDARQRIAGTEDIYEVAGWGEKRRIAQSILEKTATFDERSIIESEVDPRNETVEVLAQKIIANANHYAILSGELNRIKRAALKAIDASKTKEQIDSLIDSIKIEIAKMQEI